MKKTVFTSFLLPASNEVISFSITRYERRLLRMNSFERLLAKTIVNYAEPIGEEDYEELKEMKKIRDL